MLGDTGLSIPREDVAELKYAWYTKKAGQYKSHYSGLRKKKKKSPLLKQPFRALIHIVENLIKCPIRLGLIIIGGISIRKSRAMMIYFTWDDFKVYVTSWLGLLAFKAEFFSDLELGPPTDD